VAVDVTGTVTVISSSAQKISDTVNPLVMYCVLTYEAVSFGAGAGGGGGGGGDGVGSGAFGAGVSTAAILTAAAEDEMAAKTAPGTYAEDSAGEIETPEEYARVGTGAASTTGASLLFGLEFPAYAGPLRIGGFPGSCVNLPETFRDLRETGSSILQVS